MAFIREACTGRIIRYKLRGDVHGFDWFPLQALHNGMVCLDPQSGSLFTQVPTHPQAPRLEDYIIATNEGIALLRAQPGFDFALTFLSEPLFGRVPFLFEFAKEALDKTGNWMGSSIPARNFYWEASAFTR